MSDNNHNNHGGSGASLPPPSPLGTDDRPFSREELRAINAETSDRLPAGQDMDTMVVLMDIDPCHVHVYWHVRREDLDAAQGQRNRNGPPHGMILRVQEALCAGMHGFIPWQPLEFEVTGLDGYRYLEIPDCGRTLVADLGLRGSDGTFIALGSSGPVCLPGSAQAGNEIPEQVELVIIDEPGSPPRLVEVVEAPSAASSPVSSKASPDPAVSRGFSQVVPDAAAASAEAPSSQALPFQPDTEPWFWSGGPLPGFSGRAPK